MSDRDVLPLCAASEVAQNTMRGVKAEGTDYLVVNDGGTFRVYRNVCPHRGARLSGGTLERGVLTCPWHHSQFDIRTGKLLSGPKVGPALPFLRRIIAAFVRDVHSYPVVLQGDMVCVVREQV